jgi:hypothetical protein
VSLVLRTLFPAAVLLTSSITLFWTTLQERAQRLDFWRTQCAPALQLSRDLLDRPDSRLHEADRQSLSEKWRPVLGDPHCARLAFEQLRLHPGRCGIGFDWISHELFYATLEQDPSLSQILALLKESPLPCRGRVLFQASFLPRTTPEVAQTAEAFIDSQAASPLPPLTEETQSGWLAYASLGEIADRQIPALPAVSARIQNRILERLQGPLSRAEREFFLSVAGNAGCKACLPEIRKDLESEDIGLRMTATHALRFIPHDEAVEALCAAVIRDGAVAVRDSAAWALQWRRNSIEERTECLLAAATTDPRPRIRKQATLSLLQLAEKEPYPRQALQDLLPRGAVRLN